MGGLHKWKKKVSEERVRARELEKTLKRRLRISAGAENFANKDPVYHVSDGFRQTFDLVGERRASELGGRSSSIEGDGGGMSQGSAPEEGRESAEEQRGIQSTEESQRGLSAKTSMDSVYAPSPGEEDERFMSRFSQSAFGRGTMAGAVMRGSEKMMLVSCLKRATGQSQPNKARQRMLFQGASSERNVGGHHTDKVIFNKGTVFSAVGLVVDALKDARRTVNEMTELAEGENVLPEGGGAETLRRMYPFLSDSGEREQIATYRAMLEDLEPKDVEKRRILQRAANKAQAVLNRKLQMRHNFTRHLKMLSNRAGIAAEMLESESYKEELFERLTEMAPPPEPPEDEDDEDVSEFDE